MINVKDVCMNINMDDVMEERGLSGFCIHDNRDVLLCGLNSTFATETFSAVAEERNAVCIINDAIAMIPIIEKKSSKESKTFKVTNDYTACCGYSTNQMGPLLQTKNKLSLLQNNARGGPLQVCVQKNICHGSGGNLLTCRADLWMSMVTEAAKVSSDFVEWQEIKRPQVTVNLQMHNTFTRAPFVLNASLPNASDKGEVKLAEWETTLCGIEEHLMTCIFGMLPNVIWATILSLPHICYHLAANPGTPVYPPLWN